jgi:hypothetical protein
LGIVILFPVVLLRKLLKPKNKKKPSRKEIAETKKARSAYEAKRDQEWALQGFCYKEFKESLEKAMSQGKEHRWSLLIFTQTVLSLTEKQIFGYQDKCLKKHLIDKYMPNYYHVVMKHAVESIVQYSEGKHLSGIGLELMRFVEEHFRIKGIQGVFYRHRQHLHYSERCEAMSIAILSFFSQNIAKTTMDYATKPFDYLTDEDMTEWELVIKEFFRKAVDEYFNDAVKGIERSNYATQARRDNQEHQKNRRQRSARVKKQNRKQRKAGYA